MKAIILFLASAVSSVTFDVFGQKNVISADRELSMSQATRKYEEGVWTYYERGENEPFTGILFARYANGNYESRQEYEDGVGEGTWINYWPNGNLREVGTYDQNKVKGPIRKYYESGKLKSEGTYREWRIRVGVWNYYNEEGNLVEVVDHGKEGDFRDVEEYYQNGEISESWYRDIISN